MIADIKRGLLKVLGRDAYVTIDPPVDGESKYFGNSFNSNRAPPKTIDFPLDYAVKVCFHSGSVVDGHKGFKVELTEKPNTFWVTSPNYPVITGENFEDPPKHGYGPALHYCTVRAPPRKGGALEMEFYQFDVSFEGFHMIDFLLFQCCRLMHHHKQTEIGSLFTRTRLLCQNTT